MGCLTDLEILERWCDLCLEYPNPLLFRDIQGRGLSKVIEKLPKDVEEAKAEVQFRLKILHDNIELINRERQQQQLMAIEKNKIIAITAELFYKEFEIPFKFDVGEKEVLSGLSENSWGDGRRKNTVIHLMLEEDWTEGRLKRKKGDFLCTSASRSNGNSWSGQNTHLRHYDGQNFQYMPKITCKQCLKIIQRYATT